jgi:hypothetical protein
MPSRRRFLAFAATATASALAGCTAEVPTGDTTVDTPPSSLDEGDRVRARGSAISAERELSVDDGNEYVESNETIRYPATKSGGEVESYGHISVDEWMPLETMFVADQAVHAHLESELSSTEWLSVYGTERGGPETELDVVHTTYEIEDGPDDEPAIPAAELVSVTPRAVDVTGHFRDETVTQTYPVFVVKWVGEHLWDQTTNESA